MNHSIKTCDLCGLSLRAHSPTLTLSGKTYDFCCPGCRQVFRILSAMPGNNNPDTFKESDLFKQCQDMGIIPRSEEDLADRRKNPPSSSFNENTIDTDSETEESPNALVLNLMVEGMWCPACAWVIEKMLLNLEGVDSASCVFSTDRVRCSYNPVKTSPFRIIQLIDDLGYHGVLPEDAGNISHRKEWLRLVVSAILTINVMMLSFALYTGFFTHLSPMTVTYLSLPIFFMASIVQFYGGRSIYKKALAGFALAGFSMETLISIGAFSAYTYSVYRLFSGSLHLYFDTASMLITLVLIGKILENGVKRNIQEDLNSFLSFQPTKARIYTDLYPEGRYVSSAYLNPEDTFIVETGEIIPADGEVLEGAGTINESTLTGEAEPISKKPGDYLKSGASVIEGTFRVRTTAVGEKTILGQMIRIMEKTLSEKTPVEGKTDILIRWFVPTILFLSFATAVGCLLIGVSAEDGIIRAITILVIACPCSLGIAIPLARVAGVSLANRKGILIRNPDVFEAARHLDTFVFDKTGTLTTGQWTLHTILPMGSFTQMQALSLAVSLEISSSHPIASAIKKQAEKTFAPLVTLENITVFDNGISALDGDRQVKIGSYRFMEPEIRSSHNAKIVDSTPDSTVFMSSNGTLCAILLLGDRIRPEAGETIQQLKVMGYRISLVSGDSENTTQTVGQAVGLSDAFGGKLPHEKAAYIRSLKDQHRFVAMVGDGINDAPALTQSDLAMGMYSGGYLNKESSDITLMRGNLRSVIAFLDLAGQVNRKVHQNLIWAFLYNTISIPLAMSGMLTPLIAVSAMLLSSLSVIGNTLLLTRKSN